MDSLVAEQVWAVVMFVLGSFILNTCSKGGGQTRLF